MGMNKIFSLIRHRCYYFMYVVGEITGIEGLKESSEIQRDLKKVF